MDPAGVAAHPKCPRRHTQRLRRVYEGRSWTNDPGEGGDGVGFAVLSYEFRALLNLKAWHSYGIHGALMR
jgi:hypothetical protein